MKNCLYYNTNSVPDLIRQECPLVKPYLSENYSDSLFKFYNKYKMDTTNVVYDRTDTLPHYINFQKNNFPLPKITNDFSKSFEQCVEERAKEILDLNKPISVVWSGGIDSTLALFALLQFCNDPSQITIYGTYNSILESGNLFERFILPRGVKYEFTVTKKSNFPDQNCVYVTGFMGNQLFGPVDDFAGITTLCHHQFRSEDIEDPYEKCIDEEMHNFLLPLIKKYPKKIETVRDLRWLFIFNFDWHTSHYDALVKTKNHKQVYHFFDTEDMQRYVMTTKDPFTKVKGNPLTHRWVMRELIEHYGKCSHYAWNKPKGISNLSNRAADWCFLLPDYSLVINKPDVNI